MFNRDVNGRQQYFPQNSPLNMETMMLLATQQYINHLRDNDLVIPADGEICFLQSCDVTTNEMPFVHYKVRLQSHFLHDKLSEFLTDKTGTVGVAFDESFRELLVIPKELVASLTYKDQHEFLFNLNKALQSGQARTEIDMLKLQAESQSTINLKGTVI